MWSKIEVRGDAIVVLAEMQSLMRAIQMAAKSLGLLGRVVWVATLTSGEKDVFIPPDVATIADDHVLAPYKIVSIAQPNLYYASKVEI